MRDTSFEYIYVTVPQFGSLRGIVTVNKVWQSGVIRLCTTLEDHMNNFSLLVSFRLPAENLYYYIFYF